MFRNTLSILRFLVDKAYFCRFWLRKILKILKPVSILSRIGDLFATLESGRFVGVRYAISRVGASLAVLSGPSL